MHNQWRRGVDPPSRSRTLLQRKGRHNPAQTQSCAIQKEEGNDPHYTVMHNQQRRGVNPPSRSRTLLQRKGRHYPAQTQSCAIQKRKATTRITRSCTTNRERRRPAVAVTHAPAKEGGIDLHKCSHAQSKKRKASARITRSCATNREETSTRRRSHAHSYKERKPSTSTSAVVCNPKEEGIDLCYTVIHNQQNEGGKSTRRRGRTLVQRMKASTCTSAVMHNPTEGRYRPTGRGHVRPTKKRRHRPAVAVARTRDSQAQCERK
ncbi:hypothetical protein EV702DRAFT_1043241 [Suillus placidus]|uniref:Uncharacterized protein n=1 Tax=Suillus placidus TaxID=48579 RepID=A0A9P7D4Y3_9AGAM|nr:hypothetical protein EV702DRAFT_1043241 [Suillus placidus]